MMIESSKHEQLLCWLFLRYLAAWLVSLSSVTHREDRLLAEAIA